MRALLRRLRTVTLAMPVAVAAAVPFYLAVTLIAQDALAHGGGLNAEGCHNNRNTGDYHCHRAPAVTAVSDTAPQPAQATKGKSLPDGATASQSAPPTCHVGPRGGTYTITKSGRKNYSGC